MTDEGGKDDARIAAQWFADRFHVGQNAFEFRVDCGHDGAESERMTVYMRVITSPVNARELFRLLGAGLLNYADTFGPIDDDPGADRSSA